MSRAFFVLLGFAICGSGCNDDPYTNLAGDPCAAGNTRSGGDTACVLPTTTAIAIDGRTDDWSSFDDVPLGAGCDAGCDPLPATLRMAVVHGTAGDALALRVILAGGAAPAKTDATHRYVVEMSALPSHALPVVDTVDVNASGVAYERSRVAIPLGASGSPDVRVAWTADGFEASVPFSLLPFQEGVKLRAYVERADGDDWIAAGDVGSPALACWDASDLRGDPCR